MIGYGITSHVFVHEKNKSMVIKKYIDNEEPDNEIYFYTTFKHKNIIKMYDHYEINYELIEKENKKDIFHQQFKYYTYALVLEKMDCSLAEFLNNNNDISLENRKYILKQILEVFSFLHNNLVVNADIKLWNILINYKSLDIKLCDLAQCYECKNLKEFNEYFGDEIWSIGFLIINIILNQKCKYFYNQYEEIEQNIFCKINWQDYDEYFKILLYDIFKNKKFISCSYILNYFL